MRKGFLIGLISIGLVSAAYAQAPSQPKDYTAHVVGYAHMDMAWLWRWEESIHDIMYNTFRNQLELMDRFPNFTYAQDQAVVFEMMERYYPDIFKGIVQKAKTGNWIPVSSSWVQMDENLPDGESLVRQFLYGQKYTKEKFGHYVRVAWQPDVFGHPYSMPQIARKAGIELYLFGRPQTPKRDPIIWWQGLDGSRVLGYSPPGWYTQPMDHHITELAIKTGQKEGVKNILMLYGQGDHGGGPNPNDVAGIEKLNQSPTDVRVKPTNVDDFLDALLKEKKDFQVWDGEHNFVFMGCYTTQAEMKRNNRISEQLLLDAEKMSEIATFMDYRDYYPNRDITEAWKLTLLNQAHDLAAGSGIGPIYQDAANQYREVFERGQRALNFSLETIGRQLETRGEGVPVVVYNSQSWERADLVTTDIAAPALADRMVAVYGEETLPVQVLRVGAREGQLDRASVAFVAQKVPQMGLKLYRILPETASRPAPPSTLQAGMEPRPFLENEFLRVELNPATGYIARLYDKQNRREAFRGEGNFLVALEDTEEQSKKVQETGDEKAGHAWDIGLTGNKWDLDKAASIELIEKGPVRAAFRVVHRFRSSQFTQIVSLVAGLPRVDVEMSMDFRERNTFIKAGFPVNTSANKVTSEIPYGAIEHDQTGHEMVMCKWVDVSQADYGVAILNNGRQGFDAKDNLIRISVIRGPIFPDPRADEGFHAFAYSIYPHREGWREGKVMQQALAFNSPLLALQEPEHHRPRDPRSGQLWGLPDAYSFVKTDSDHVLLYAMKQMEGFYDTDAILRFFECEGREGDVTLQLPRRVRATETDLLEETIGPVGEGQTIRFHMKPWEIKTLRLSRQ
jgi:alpha-mannosidase